MLDHIIPVWVEVLEAAEDGNAQREGERPLGLDCNSTALYHTVFFYDLTTLTFVSGLC